MANEGSETDGNARRSARPRPRRPWFLVAGLMLAWLVGSNATMEGWSRVMLFTSQSVDSEVARTGSMTAEEQASEQAIVDRELDALFAARKRVLPLSVASGILGVAIWSFAVGAMAGRPGGRRMLIQVIGAHAGLLVVAYAITADVRRVDIDIAREHAEAQATDLLAKQSQPVTPDDQAQLRALGARAATWVPRAQLAASLLGHGLVLLALTRRRSRAYYEPAPPVETVGS